MSCSLMKIPCGFKIRKKVDCDTFINDCMCKNNVYSVIDGNTQLIIEKDKDGNISISERFGDFANPFNPSLEVAKTKDNCSRVNWLDIEDDTPVLCEYDIPSGETREVYKCSKGNYITGFTYALGSNKIYLRYGKRFSGLFDFYCLPNHTMVITTDGRDYELHSSLIDGYNLNCTGIVVY